MSKFNLLIFDLCDENVNEVYIEFENISKHKVLFNSIISDCENITSLRIDMNYFRCQLFNGLDVKTSLLTNHIRFENFENKIIKKLDISCNKNFKVDQLIEKNKDLLFYLRKSKI